MAKVTELARDRPNEVREYARGVRGHGPPENFEKFYAIGGANYAVLFLWTAYANDSQQVITVSSHFKFVLIVVVPVGFVSRDFCAKVAFFC